MRERYEDKFTDFQIHRRDNLVEKILAWIDMDLSGNLTLKHFAKALNVNASYLSKTFSREMGVSLTEYVNSCRIKKACRILENTNLKLESIARQCGFANTHYFIRQFKK